MCCVLSHFASDNTFLIYTNTAISFINTSTRNLTCNEIIKQKQNKKLYKSTYHIEYIIYFCLNTTLYYLDIGTFVFI